MNSMSQGSLEATDTLKKNETEKILVDEAVEMSVIKDELPIRGIVKTPRSSVRKSKPFQPIIMIITMLTLLFVLPLSAQLSTSVTIGAEYTDNAFQLSEYDIQRYEEANQDMKFMEASDDVILKSRLSLGYEKQLGWWTLVPVFQGNIARNILNSDKQKLDMTTGFRLSRRLGELGVYYGYYPNVYLRDYVDSDGTDRLEPFEYAKNQYKADIKIKPFKKTTALLEFKREDFFYNKYFTEFDGTTDSWKLGFNQSFSTFYFDAAYTYKVFDTDSEAAISNSEDSSYESNVYTIGVLIKKMPVDTQYPEVMWRPELSLGFEQRYFQGSDSWHAGRTDNINNTDATLQFYFGENWNINLDYSHIFRNVDAMNSSVRKYKEYTENKYGLSVRYQF